MTTTEGNKLIAEFMGGKVSYFSVTNFPHYKGLTHGRNILFEDLKYHSSWDWLMPACHKWDSLTDAEIIEGTWYQYEDLCEILDAKVSLYEILPVWEQLVKNIEWYNQSKTPQP
jgi:hypothetical protein